MSLDLLIRHNGSKMNGDKTRIEMSTVCYTKTRESNHIQAYEAVKERPRRWGIELLACIHIV